MQACPDRSLNYLFTNDELSRALWTLVHLHPRDFLLFRVHVSLSLSSPRTSLQRLSISFPPSILGQRRFLERWRRCRVPEDSNLEKWIRNNKGIGLCKDRINICFPRFWEKRIIRWTAHREFRPRLKRKLYPWRTEGNLGGGGRGGGGWRGWFVWWKNEI